MIDTNQLLSICFTVISNFASMAHLPRECVPNTPQDLVRLVVGSPRSPIDLYLVNRTGDEFWISEGIVEQYLSPDSYFNLQSASSLRRLAGKATMGSNDVVSLAYSIIRALAKGTNPAARAKPIIKTAQAKDFPFYLINWPNTNAHNYGGFASVEIDARRARPVFVQLWSPEYYDVALAGQISNRVYTAETKPAPSKQDSVSQDDLRWKPDVATMKSLIPKWLRFCDNLGLAPGPQTNLDYVDWKQTFKAEAPAPLPPGTLYKIVFKNGAAFETVNETVFGHNGFDASFVGAWADKPNEYWKSFTGPAVYTWAQLAAQLNSRLNAKLGISKAYLNRFAPTAYTVGTNGMSRCTVNWYDTKSSAVKSPVSAPIAIAAEFDLASGEIKSVTFFDFELLRWEARIVSKP